MLKRLAAQKKQKRQEATEVAATAKTKKEFVDQFLAASEKQRAGMIFDLFQTLETETEAAADGIRRLHRRTRGLIRFK